MKLFDIPFSQLAVDQIIDKLIGGERSKSTPKQSVVVHFVNAYTVTNAHENSNVKLALNDSRAINVIDGRSLLLAKKIFGIPEELTQIRGIDFLIKVFSESQYSECRHAIVGSDPETLKMCEERLKESFPLAKIPLLFSPPILPVEEILIEEIRDLLQEHRIDICWLALGTPKQDIVAHRLSQEVESTVVCIGAAVNYLSGNVEAPPPIIVRLGLEWLFRFIKEPRRLFVRYFVGLPKFAILTVTFKRNF